MFVTQTAPPICRDVSVRFSAREGAAISDFSTRWRLIKRRFCQSDADAPIQRCSLSESVFDIGIGTLVLARGATPHHTQLTPPMPFIQFLANPVFSQIAPFPGRELGQPVSLIGASQHAP